MLDAQKKLELRNSLTAAARVTPWKKGFKVHYFNIKTGKFAGLYNTNTMTEADADLHIKHYGVTKKTFRLVKKPA